MTNEEFKARVELMDTLPEITFTEGLPGRKVMDKIFELFPEFGKAQGYYADDFVIEEINKVILRTKVRVVEVFVDTNPDGDVQEIVLENGHYLGSLEDMYDNGGLRTL